MLRATLLLPLVAGLSWASTVGPNCASCNQGTYSLFYNNLQPNGPTQLVDVTFTIDASAVNQALGTLAFIQQVALKLSGSVNVSGSSILAAPGSASNWTLQGGGINANGCSGSGSGFLCANWTGSGMGPATTNGPLSWIFRISLPALDPDASLKARYVDSSGNKVGALVSEEIEATATPTPEPTTLALSTLGLIAARTLRRRG